MKLETRIKLLIFFYILLLAWALSSCGVAKKNFQTYEQKVDSSFTVVKKESDQNQKDSAKVEKEATVQTDSATIHIDFQDNQTDSSAYTDVTIKTDTSGTIVINTGGKKIKGITTSKKKTEAKTGSDSVHVVSASNVQRSDSTKTDLSKSVKSKEVKKFSFELPWYAYLIGAIFLILIYVFWGQIKTAKKIADEFRIPYNKS